MHAGELTYFSDFGDGLRYCVGILATAMNLRNTALLIEEIESHQHSGSLRKLIRHLVEIARENNLQIFLSTHSYGVWNSLARGVYLEDVETEKQEFRCFLVERDMETGKTTVETTDDVQKINAALGKP
jgi:AAA15 family ATPase/GTPase